jgi:hypothetical protein
LLKLTEVEVPLITALLVEPVVPEELEELAHFPEMTAVVMEVMGEHLLGILAEAVAEVPVDIVVMVVMLVQVMVVLEVPVSEVPEAAEVVSQILVFQTMAEVV